MSIGIGGFVIDKGWFQPENTMLPPLAPPIVISTGYGGPVVATYRVPPVEVSVMPITFCPATVVTAPLVSVPWAGRFVSTSLVRFVSEAIEARPPVPTGACSHLP